MINNKLKFQQIYLFSKFVNIFFDFSYKLFFIKFKNCIYTLKMCSSYFFKFTNISYNFIFLNYFFFFTFIKLFLKWYSKFYSYYYFNLKLKGLGYRTRKITKKLYRIYFNRSNYYYIHIPLSILLKYRTRKFFFLSIDKAALKLVVLNLLLLKERIIYRYSGLIYPKQIFLIKPGKNKFR